MLCCGCCATRTKGRFGKDVSVDSEELFETDARCVVEESDVVCSCCDLFSAFCLLFATFLI